LILLFIKSLSIWW